MDSEEHFYLELLDAEGDLIRCDFNYDDSATLDTSDLTYIILTSQNLSFLSECVEFVENYFNKKREYEIN